MGTNMEMQIIKSMVYCGDSIIVLREIRCIQDMTLLQKKKWVLSGCNALQVQLWCLHVDSKQQNLGSDISHGSLGSDSQLAGYKLQRTTSGYDLNQKNLKSLN